MNKLTAYFNKRIIAWLTKRIPPSTEHQLSSRNIFIFPSLFGFAYLLMVLIIFLLGTNYQNNIILMFSFLLGSIFVTTMMLSFQNLQGLNVALLKAPEGFAQQNTLLSLLMSTSKNHHQLVLSVEGNASIHKEIAQLSAQQSSHKMTVSCFSSTRGISTLPRLRLESRFPFGLFNTWTRLDLNCQHTVYPTPLLPKQKINTQLANHNESQGQTITNQGNDEFFQLDNYQQGQALSKVAWKQLAKSNVWLSKTYHDHQSREAWLDIHQMPASHLEAKLSQLSALVLEYSGAGQTFGLKLMHTSIEPNSGLEHQKNCLIALAEA